MPNVASDPARYRRLGQCVAQLTWHRDDRRVELAVVAALRNTASDDRDWKTPKLRSGVPADSCAPVAPALVCDGRAAGAAIMRPAISLADAMQSPFATSIPPRLERHARRSADG